MTEIEKEPRFAQLRCPVCASKREGALIQHDNSTLVCAEPGCDMVYPIQDGVAVMLTFGGDFYHLRKALDPADIRVHRQTRE